MARLQLPNPFVIRLAGVTAIVVALSSGCATTPDVERTIEPSASTTPTNSVDFPDVIGALATNEGDGFWRFDVTVSSPYDSAVRYADAWRVLDGDGNELGIRILTHDHASEQPFTRSQGGIAVPADIHQVTIQGRDLTNGWGGGTLEINLDAPEEP